MTVTAIPLFWKGNAASHSYAELRDQIHNITSTYVQVLESTAVVHGDSEAVCKTLHLEERFRPLRTSDLPCIWIEASDGYFFWLPWPKNNDDTLHFFAHLTEIAKSAKTGRELETLLKAPPNQGSTHNLLVVLIHGIRTQGEWQDRLKAELEKTSGVIVQPLKYKFFDAFSFWLPFGPRNSAVAKVKQRLTDTLALHEAKDLVIVAHSFGTFLTAKILLDSPGIKPVRILFCGSVVDRDCRWALLPQKPQPKILNDCGSRDIWPVLAEAMSWDYGASGTFGFGSGGVTDRFHDLGHSDYFKTENKILEDYWLPWLLAGAIQPSPHSSQRRTTSWFWSILPKLPVRWLLLLAILIGLWFLFQIGASYMRARNERAATPGIPEFQMSAVPDGIKLWSGEAGITSKDSGAQRLFKLQIKNTNKISISRLSIRTQFPEPIIKLKSDASSDMGFASSQIWDEPLVKVQGEMPPAKRFGDQVTGLWRIEAATMPGATTLTIEVLTTIGQNSEMYYGSTGGNYKDGMPTTEGTTQPPFLWFLAGSYQFDRGTESETKDFIVPLNYERKQRLVTALPAVECGLNATNWLEISFMPGVDLGFMQSMGSITIKPPGPILGNPNLKPTMMIEKIGEGRSSARSSAENGAKK